MVFVHVWAGLPFCFDSLFKWSLICFWLSFVRFSNSNVFEYVHTDVDCGRQVLCHHVPHEVSGDTAQGQLLTDPGLGSRHCYSNPTPVCLLLHGTTMAGRSGDILRWKMADERTWEQEMWLWTKREKDILDNCVCCTELGANGANDACLHVYCD